MRPTSNPRRGHFMPAVATFIAIVTCLALLLLALELQRSDGERSEDAALRARLAAEAGLVAAISDLESGGEGAFQRPLAIGGAQARVEARPEPGGGVRLVSTGRSGEREEQLERRLRREQAWPFALFASGRVAVEGEARVDSYDSAAGPYEEQVRRRGLAARHAGEAARLAAGGPIEVAAGARVHGALSAGFERAAARALSAPPVELGAALEVVGGQLARLDAGLHGLERIELGEGAALVVRGPATIVCDALRLAAGAELLADGEHGPVELHVRGELWLARGATLGSLERVPARLAVHAHGEDVELAPDVSLCATLAAPRAALRLSGEAELFGALSAREITLSDRARVHWDERLATDAQDLLAWRALGSGSPQEHDEDR